MPTLSDIIWSICFSFINCKETTHLAASLSILVCLCENNFIFKKYLLSLLTEEDRKNLFVKCMQNQKLQVNKKLNSLWASTTTMNYWKIWISEMSDYRTVLPPVFVCQVPYWMTEIRTTVFLFGLFVNKRSGFQAWSLKLDHWIRYLNGIWIPQLLDDKSGI